MSILDDSNNLPTSEAQSCANNIVEQARNTFNLMASSFNYGSNIFWNNPNLTPTEIAEALGSNAREVFQLHYMLGQLISNIKPDVISEGISKIGKFNMNEDGTVTILDAS